MPIKRFLRNLRKGHVFGLFHKRSHYRFDGKEKVSYNTKKSAEKAAKKMMKKQGVYFSNYKCLFCDGYHLCKNRETKEKSQEEKFEELWFLFLRKLDKEVFDQDPENLLEVRTKNFLGSREKYKKLLKEAFEEIENDKSNSHQKTGVRFN